MVKFKGSRKYKPIKKMVTSKTGRAVDKTYYIVREKPFFFKLKAEQKGQGGLLETLARDKKTALKKAKQYEKWHMKKGFGEIETKYVGMKDPRKKKRR